MSLFEDLNTDPAETEVIRITADERAREAALRERFASFWKSASGEPRVIYDAFIAATPLATEVTLDAVEEDGVRGWWVRPTHAHPAQAILYIHGGGYGLGSARAYRGFVSQVVSRTQVPALAIDYPLAPEASLPAAPLAALTAWRWLVNQRCNQIAVVGDSAGGGLTLVTLAELGRRTVGPAPIAGVVFSPWADLAFTGASMTDSAVTDPLITHDYLQDCARKYLGNVGPTDPLASPLFGDFRGLPPLLIQVGTDERLLDDARQFAKRAAQAGVRVRCEVWEGMHHVFQLDVAHLESSRAALDRTARFLRGAFNA
ncbi:alpha/beta hydrolase [Plastoroseomonas hellenica]|uniref:alpha/beta hydrolase n=1 Tax=Plastoroseomonas hellenica TaxID=2687306 RepID=UPI001BA4E57A|nr:alpha/beta hydrolase [Plastoroseomonas hellenica]MBR0641303.1 alpha/beta hydrolase [Plastoroseomonas hellenica]